MTRKDYELIAKAIRDTQDRINASDTGWGADTKSLLAGVRKTAAHLADALGSANPRFDATRFLKACGYGATPASMLNRDINGDAIVERRPFSN